MARRRIGVADIKAVVTAWDAGERISSIARMLGYTRPTVRKYIGAAQRVGVRRGEQRRSDLEWEEVAHRVQELLATHRDAGVAKAEIAHFHAYLATRVHETKLTVLHQRLRDEQGLRASWGTFYRYVATYWPERVHATPRPTVRLVDPAAGEEAQVDFFFVRRWLDPVTQHAHRLCAFLMTLAHSRHQFLYPVLAEDEVAWLEGHVAAFAFLGGAPRRLVPDNLTAGILKADRYDPRVNRAYSELVRYYGCLVDPARVSHPKDKPRVERGVAYARESFFRGREFGSLEQMRQEAVRWACEVAGQRIHGTTGERPFEVFVQREQSALVPLPPTAWEQVTWTGATVQADCHLTVARTHYSVPYRYIGRRLEVRLGQRVVAIYDGADLVTTHPRQLQGRVTRLEHYAPSGQAFLRATPQVCRQRAQAVGVATTALVEPLLAPGLLYLLREVQALLRLTDRYAPAELEAACAQALEAGDGRYRTVRGLLEQREGRRAPAALAEREYERTLKSNLELDRVGARDLGQDRPWGKEMGSASGAFLRGPTAFALPAPPSEPTGLVSTLATSGQSTEHRQEQQREEQQEEVPS